ncbi:uncharacterized protein BP5553_10528 [Venustampulla echinocandica]|uniref:Uncharacterized protein n=1 Tax=Venustampulla echinocandica TaxID=2656787 RepID=A0A370T8U4_9HELO|nr:uncharacterized protein BP5553_10528 [Venustampulla echinocandica]RDL29901.1 hypothetical protein BP5553_10528 [Venustampulla echinocandica]
MPNKEDLMSNDSSNSSSHRLLSDEQGYEYPEESFHQNSRRSWLRPLFVHLVILVTYTLAFFALYKKTNGQNCHRDMIFSPAREAVEYQLLHAENDLMKESPYAGFPNDGSDAAWRELLKNSNIRITAEELKKLNRTSIQLQDGSGDYFGGLSAHHHLHCIKSVRRVIYRDHYGLPDEPWMWSHLDHCLEDLRQSVMCNADFSVITYDWLPNYRRPWANFKVDGECVNWEKLDAWAGDRFFSLFDQKALVHPELGISYPIVDGVIPTDSTPHPTKSDIQALKDGTNPKDKFYEAPMPLYGSISAEGWHSMRMATNVSTTLYVPAADNFLAQLNWTNGSVSSQVTLRSSTQEPPFAEYPGNDEDQLLNLTILPNNLASLTFPVASMEYYDNNGSATTILTGSVFALAGTLLDPNAHHQPVPCINPLSGQYGKLPRTLFYCLLIFSLIFRRHEWLALAALGTAMTYAAVSAIHLIGLAVRSQFSDPDNFGIFPILSTSGIMLTPILMWSTSVKKHQAQAVIIYWGILVFAAFVYATYGMVRLDVDVLFPVQSLIVCTPTPECSPVPSPVTAKDFDRCNCIDFCGVLGDDSPMRKSGNMVAGLPTESALAAQTTGFNNLYIINYLALVFIFVNGIVGIIGSRFSQEQVRNTIFRFLNADRRKLVSKLFGGQRKNELLARFGLQNPDVSPTTWSKWRYVLAKGIATFFYLTAVSLTILCPIVFVTNIIVNEVAIGMFPVGERSDAVGAWGAWAGALLVLFAAVVDKYSKAWMDSILLALEGAWIIVKYSKDDRAGKKPTISKRVEERNMGRRIIAFFGVVVSPFVHSWYSTRRGFWTVKIHMKFFVAWWRQTENMSKQTRAEIERAWEDEQLRIVGGMPTCRCHICTKDFVGKNAEIDDHDDMPGIESRKERNRWNRGSEDDMALASTAPSRPLLAASSSLTPLLATPQNPVPTSSSGPVDAYETSSLLDSHNSSPDPTGGDQQPIVDGDQPPPKDGGHSPSKARDQLSSKAGAQPPSMDGDHPHTTTQAASSAPNTPQTSTAGDHGPAIATQNTDHSPSQ